MINKFLIFFKFEFQANADEGVFYPVRVVDVDMDNGLTVICFFSF